MKLIHLTKHQSKDMYHVKNLTIQAVFVLLAGLASCSPKEEAKVELVPDVNFVAVAMRTVPVYTEYVGETFGISDVDIRSRVGGWVTSMQFKEGSFVQKGQLLYVIDDEPIKARIEASQARLAETKTMMVKAKADLDRVEPLAKMNALSQRDLDAAKAAYDASLSEVNIAEAQLRSSQIELSYTKITAPISGIIGISDVMVGDFANAGNMGKPLNTISATGDVRIRFPLSEAEYLRFVKRMRADANEVKKIIEVPVQLVLADGVLYNETGKLDLANRQVDAATGSLLMQAIFSNKQNIIRPGQYVKVRFKTDEYDNALLVPQQTVNQVQSIYQVFVINDSNKLAPRIIKPGARVGANWIVTEGLKAGEKVAIIGNANINLKNAVKPMAMPWNFDSTLQQ